MLKKKMMGEHGGGISDNKKVCATAVIDDDDGCRYRATARGTKRSVCFGCFLMILPLDLFILGKEGFTAFRCFYIVNISTVS